MAYTNGVLPTGILVHTLNGLQLRAPAAASLQTVAQEIKRVYGWSLSLTDAYRTKAIQEKIFRERYTTTYLAGRPYKVWNGQRWYQRAGTAQAAVPGTSNHGLGLAIDVANLGGFSGTRYKQFAQVASKYGWTNTEGRSINEPWHWVYSGNMETSTPDAADTETKEEDDMFEASDRSNLDELRRFIGVIAGTVTAGNDAERRLAQRLAALDVLIDADNVTESRRMLGVILGWQPAQGPEVKALTKLYN